MSPALYSTLIRTEEDVVSARRLARDIASLLGFDVNDQTRLATSVSEIARNAFVYGGGGKVEFGIVQDEAPAFRIAISDSGPGIAELERVLDGTYKSPTGMGLGISGARRLMDRFTIDSKPGQGTTVTLTKLFPPGAPPVTPQRLARISSELARFKPRDVMDELRAENQELLRVMEELRLRQEDLTRLNAELEDTNRGVVALYAELDERAERLRRADQMKSRFLSYMSHEFRTPLTSIMALSRLLQDGADGKLQPEQQKQVTFIRKSAESLLDMVSDLLDLARVEAGKVVVRPAPFHVSGLFGVLRSVLRPLLVNDDVELIFDDPAGIPPLFSDEAKVAQILRNFISNALKFTERGEVRVSARLSADGSMVIFAVSDTGIGIAAEHLNLIFQEFGQVDSEVQRRVRGTGLGLPLSRGLAEVLGGGVRVESRPGEGSCFYAEIPLTYTGEGAEPAVTSDKLEYLLIDDEEVSRYLVRQCLDSARLMEAADGPSGIELARRHRPRAILLDLRMPGMSGFEVLRSLAHDPATKEIPVIIMTAMALTAEHRSQLEQYAAAVISKEILSQPDAGARIRSVVDSASSSRRNAGAAWR